jgi:GMP synthase (glutamine-hydrolysing)
MAKLLVFQHVAYEILGTLDPLLRTAKIRIRYVNFQRHPHAEPTLDGYDGLVVLGGPMNVDEDATYPHLRTELRVIEEALTRKMPILGICLGGQLLAKALGAEVRRNGRPEIGWSSIDPTPEGRRDRIIGHIGERTPMFQWHGDTFAIPSGAVHLARSEVCENQAFRYGDRAWGVQFHAEVDAPMIERWLNVPPMARELEHASIAADDVRAATALHIEGLTQTATRAFTEFVSLLPAKRRAVLRTR